MGIDVNMVHNLASGLAAGERNAANQGKHVNQKGWVTKEQMRKDAAQKTIALLVLILLAQFIIKILLFFGRLSIKLFGPKLGWTINIIGIILLIGIPACTIKVSSDRQQAEAAAAEEARQVAEANFRKQEIEKIDTYRSEVRAKVNALSARCDDQEAFKTILATFETSSRVEWNPSMSDKYAFETIDRAYKSCVEAVDLIDEKKIYAYFKIKADEVKDAADETTSKLRNVRASDEAVHIRYARDQFVQSHKYSREGIRLNTPFDQAKAEIDSDAQKCIEKMKSIQSKGETRSRINQYIKARETDLEALAKKDLYRRGDYHVEMFKRKMIPSSIGGKINFDAEFDDVKAVIDEEYRATEQKILEAAKK